ncbi:YicC/YloC family endoribonuclease [Desulfocurvus sp. DL9XJH121]
MIKSMTGFGRFLLQDKDWSQEWEIRSVNGRHLDVKWRLPANVRCLETNFERQVRNHASRGRVNINLNLQVTRADILGVHLNQPMAEAMLTQMERFASRMEYPFKPDFSRLMGMSFLWEDQGGEPDPELVESLAAGLEEALRDWDESRSVEGQATRKDLSRRLISLEEWLAQLKERAPQIKEERFATVEARIQQVLDRYSIDLDQERLLQEVAVLSDKLDVSEELSRLSAHLEGIGKILENGADAGKRLDFMLQECFREINTCGNKAQDTQVSRIVVDFKTELEKCREQVQNVE